MAKRKPVTTEELQKAWDTVAEFMNQHEELSFFITPFGGAGRQYTLHTAGPRVELIRASKSWNK